MRRPLVEVVDERAYIVELSEVGESEAVICGEAGPRSTSKIAEQ
jgi:hypothetical protein